MKTRLLYLRAARFCRLFSLVLVGVVCLAGGDCGGNNSNNSNTDNPPLDGGNPGGTPPAPPPTPQETLVSLINSQIRTNGLSQLTTDTIATNVAQAHSDFMLSTNQLTEVMNGQDFTTRLIAAGAGAPVNSTNVVSKGFADPQALVTAMLNDATILKDLQGNTYTRIGVGLSGPGAGNYWTILLY